MFWTQWASYLSAFMIGTALLRQLTGRSESTNSERKTVGAPLKGRIIAAAVLITFAALIDYVSLPQSDATLRTVVQIGIVTVLGLAAALAWFGLVLFLRSSADGAEQTQESETAADDADDMDDSEGFKGVVAVCVILTLACVGLAVYFWIWN